MKRPGAFAALIVSVVALTFAADRYSGPRPPKADVPYLMHADNLIETEVGTAVTEQRKDATYAIIDGPASPVRTPLPEPIFLLRTEKLVPEKLELYRLESKNGKREVLIGHKKPKNVPRPLYLSVTRLDEKLYRIEADEPLQNGEYSLTPSGSNDTFSFAVY